ncbi:MAG: pyridoxamine 5'-phosphate oxidase family protein [Clostridia bacterium]|nr:pyridoxamine 5'-phosphate oxidase family protein [Clostridia bacterium]
MPREMRRFKQQLDESEVKRILRENTSGALSLIDKDGYPYCVPLSYVYEYGAIYFHSAKSGHKIDAIRNCEKACFSIIDKDDVQPEKYTTFYKSVIAFGKVSIVENADEAMHAIKALGEKYYPEHETELNAEIDKSRNSFLIIKFQTERVTGKQAIELV